MDLGALRKKLGRLPPHQVVGHYLYQGAHRLAGVDLVRAFCLTPANAYTPLPARGVGRCERLDPARVMEEAVRADSGLTVDDATARLAVGEECFGVFVDAVLASHTWFSTRPAPLRDGINVRFDPRYAYSRWAYTRPEFRGRGIHVLGNRYALSQFAAEGRLGILSVVKVANFESLHSAARQGSRPVGHLLAASFGGRELLWASAGCRAYGLSLESVAASATGADPAAVRNAPGE